GSVGRRGPLDRHTTLGRPTMTSNGRIGSRVLVVEPRAALAALIAQRLNTINGLEVVPWEADHGGARITDTIVSRGFDVLVYSPLARRVRDLVPDLGEAEEVLGACARSGIRQVVLLSSAAAYGADHHNPGLVREARPAALRRPNRVAEAWRAVESLAE